MRNLIAGGIITLVVLSAVWTAITSRRLLRRSLGRDIKAGEEVSLKSWMQVSDSELDAANRALDKDPFERVLRVVQRLKR